MTISLLIVYATVLSLFCATFLKLISIAFSYHWLISQLDSPEGVFLDRELSRDQSLRFFLLIPLFQEQEVISQALSYFAAILEESKDYPLEVIFICSDREKEQGIHPSTFNIVQSSLSSLRSDRRIRLLNSPSSYRWMAGQINFALESIKAECSGKQFYVAIYNVDSRPTSHAIRKNFSILLSNKDTCSVVQQYGSYTNNLPLAPTSFQDCILQESCVWQTSWSFQFEIRNCLYNNFLRRLPLLPKHRELLSKFSYVVGHGLYIGSSVIESVGLFTEHFLNEDMEYSLRLHSAKVRIIPAVGLDPVDMPLSIRDYLIQQRVWSRGPLLALRYWSNIARSFSWSEKLSSLFWAVKLFLHFIYWLLGPLILNLAILLCIYLEAYTMLALLIVSACAYFLSIFYVPVVLMRTRVEKLQRLRLWGSLRLFYIWIFYTLHSLGPLWALGEEIASALCDFQTQKPRTRKQAKHEL